MKALKILCLGLLALLGVHALRHVWLVLAHPYPIEYGEGVNLLWTQRAEAGEPLYPKVSEDHLPHLHNPYPPLAPLLGGWISGFVKSPHPFLPGRVLSVLGTLLAAQALWSLARARARASREAAWIGTGLFLLSPMVLRFGPMMRVDPLALGLSLQALRCLERGQTPYRSAVAAVLAASAILVKPSYCAAALYVAFSLLRARQIRPIVAAFVGGQALFWFTGFTLFLRESPQLGLHLWTLQKLPADPWGTLAWLGPFAGTHALVLAAGLLCLGTDPVFRGPRTYAWLACLPLVLLAWKTGAQENYLMEVWALACLGLAACWDRVRGQTPYIAWAALLGQGLLFLPIAPAPVFTRTYGQEMSAGGRSAWTPDATDAEIGRLLLSELRSDEGPMLSSDLGYLLLSGREVLFQPYQFGKLHRAGDWDAHALDAALAADAFRFILLKGNAETGGDPFFSAHQQALIAQRCTLHRVIGPWHLYAGHRPAPVTEQPSPRSANMDTTPPTAPQIVPCDAPKGIPCLAQDPAFGHPGMDHIDLLGYSGMAFRIQALPREVLCPSTVSPRYGFQPAERLTVVSTAALRQAQRLAEVGLFGDYLSGASAYDLWIRVLEAEEGSDWLQEQIHSHAVEDAGLPTLNAYCFRALLHARKAAAPFLRRRAADLEGPSVRHIEEAAAAYDQVVKILEEVGKPAWKPDARPKQAEAMRRARDLERQAAASIGQALAR